MKLERQCSHPPSVLAFRFCTRLPEISPQTGTNLVGLFPRLTSVSITSGLSHPYQSENEVTPRPSLLGMLVLVLGGAAFRRPLRPCAKPPAHSDKYSRGPTKPSNSFRWINRNGCPRAPQRISRRPPAFREDALPVESQALSPGSPRAFSRTYSTDTGYRRRGGTAPRALLRTCPASVRSDRPMPLSGPHSDP
jgi:hypothetical protein